MNNMELISLVCEYQNGNKDNFNELFEVFRKLLVFYAKKLHFDDALQELNTFLVELLYTIRLDKFSSDDTICLQKYISVCIRNKYIALSKQYQQNNLVYVAFCEDIATTGVPFEDNIMLSEGLSPLTQKQAQIIVYKYVWEYSDSSISHMLHISRQSVNRLKNRGLLILKNYYLK